MSCTDTQGVISLFARTGARLRNPRAPHSPFHNYGNSYVEVAKLAMECGGANHGRGAAANNGSGRGYGQGGRGAGQGGIIGCGGFYEQPFHPVYGGGEAMRVELLAAEEEGTIMTTVVGAETEPVTTAVSEVVLPMAMVVIGGVQTMVAVALGKQLASSMTTATQPRIRWMLLLREQGAVGGAPTPVVATDTLA